MYWPTEPLESAHYSLPLVWALRCTSEFKVSSVSFIPLCLLPPSSGAPLQCCTSMSWCIQFVHSELVSLCLSFRASSPWCHEPHSSLLRSSILLHGLFLRCWSLDLHIAFVQHSLHPNELKPCIHANHNRVFDQQNALKTSSSDTTLFAQDNGNGQPPQNQHLSYAKLQTKATSITKVYYRKRFKGHVGNFEKRIATVEQMLDIAGDVFPDF